MDDREFREVAVVVAAKKGTMTSIPKPRPLATDRLRSS